MYYDKTIYLNISQGVKTVTVTVYTQNTPGCREPLFLVLLGENTAP